MCPTVDWKVVWRNHNLLQMVSPVVKERAFLMKHDFLPGLRARAFRHRIRIGPLDTRCPFVFNNAPCWEDESLRHFYVECPASTEIFSKLRRCILEYTDNVNRYPVISDIQFLFGDFSSSKKKMRTAIWLLSVSLSYIYEAKMDSKIPVFEEIMRLAKEDMMIAEVCRNGSKLDLDIFDS